MSTGTSDEGTEANWISAAAAGRAAPVIRIKYDLKWKEPHWYYQQGSYKKGDVVRGGTPTL